MFPCISLVVFLQIVLSESLPETVVCADRIAPFITGGAPAAKGQLPWQVALNITTTTRKIFCGGSIIDSNWILTSAFCIQGAQEARITAGSTRLDGPFGQIQMVQAARFVLHEEYEFRNLRHNIGLIRLENNLDLNGCDASKISLASANFSEGTTVIASGWGGQGPNGTDNDKYLNYVPLHILNQQDCEKPFNNTLPPEIICAGDRPGLNGHKGICADDIGGPLVANAATKPALVGISSFYSGKGCAEGYPSWFISTLYYKSWIEAVTNIKFL